MLTDAVLCGVGSAGTAYNNLRWKELAYLIALVRSIKAMAVDAKAMKAMMPKDDLARWQASTASMQAILKKAPSDLPSASGMNQIQ